MLHGSTWSHHIAAELAVSPNVVIGGFNCLITVLTISNKHCRFQWLIFWNFRAYSMRTWWLKAKTSIQLEERTKKSSIQDHLWLLQAQIKMAQSHDESSTLKRAQRSAQYLHVRSKRLLHHAQCHEGSSIHNPITAFLLAHQEHDLQYKILISNQHSA